MTAKNFDAIVIGAGQAGTPLAGRLNAAGMSVALIERKLVGGTCVNTGCIPTKTMVASAYAAHLARRAADYGVTLGGPVGVDYKAIKARKDKVSGASRAGLEDWIASMDKCTLYRGHARFESGDTVRVGNDVLTAPKIFLNTGGRAAVPDLPGVNDIPYLTNSSMMDLDVLPSHLVVVGGSYISLEFAQMFRRFGSEVTVIEKALRLAGREDEDVSAAILSILENEGITVHVGADDIAFARQGNGIAVAFSAGKPPAVGSHVLLALGRVPNTDDLGLDKAGVEVDRHGYIVVDDQLRTSVPGIWAMGDCNGKGAFTHTSYNDYEIVAANLLDNDPRRVSDRIEAYALYIDPPLGRCGMTEAAVKKSGRRALVGQRPMTRVGRAVEKGETQGFMRILADADTGEILGCSVLGPGGDEAIHSVLDLMYAKATISTLARAMHIHPNVSELLPTIAQELKPLI
ncbi:MULTISPECIES: FAD-containing oxidoreductase [unclassified Mesorhizobium]|uniref:FAD-containing oxidoreductase n=1 Tax=unclassified Mesorhizobium TaxID=325217 RepID=UPI000F75C26A|nr:MULTISPECIES: FAD-containing oxidoreductase [unclassified Mesorhizobium]AZO22122.1 FAD-containing oxidoreductase [Mesorhizobium sp. M1E.F.Ca.ET.045.02.1.1]RUW81750.1 FAD-containing oxidoreductase [Mesorhizobium sp. M1E.F.Ca.ET.063.01.1.1]RWD87751.1 MAG: FAD-containing oxidoreductase [Mesorhizobium sp.]RWD94918.1 MAG: FAD-containing oxidoreductase [Mesorhizobium sp.]TIV51126.1 MAG: FAD-containing oxidoreductase [Mesorhizobium sp.]